MVKTDSTKPFVSEPGDLYEVVDQLKALGFILRHTPDELPMQGQHAYGLGCILDRIASEVETQITGGRA
jgi:hypothetical protein